MKACSSSNLRGDASSVVRALADEATRSATEADALRTSDAAGMAAHVCRGSDAPVARVFSRRAVWRRDRRATRRCDTDFRRVGYVEDELEPSCGESALWGSGRGEGGRQLTRGDVRRIRARTDAEERRIGRSYFSLLARFVDAQSPNYAMQLTASKPAIYALSVCHRERMLRGMHRGLAAADLVSR
jgi:hypothetical protein